MATRDHPRSELSEAAIGALDGIRKLAQDDPDTVLVSCNGQEARFKLPKPPQGSNGEGALVYFKGHWMTPPRFEEMCDMKGKVWRRSLRVYTTLEGNEMGWLRMDMWLQRLRQENNQSNKRGHGHVQGGEKNRADSEAESSGDETSLSDKSGDTSDLKTSSHRSGGQAKEVSHTQPAGSRPSRRESQQAKQISGGPSTSGGAAAAGATDKRRKSAPPTSPRAADNAAMGPPRSRPARGGPAAQASGAKIGAADATPSSAMASQPGQRISGRAGKSARGGVTTRRGQVGVDLNMPSDEHCQAEASKGTKRQTPEAETPEMKRQRIEEKVKAMAEEQQRAAEAAAVAAAAATKAREQKADWEAKQAKLAEVKRELQAKEEELEQKRQEQAEEVELLKQEQARQLEEPTQALKAAEEAVQQAQREEDEACQCFFEQLSKAPDNLRR